MEQHVRGVDSDQQAFGVVDILVQLVERKSVCHGADEPAEDRLQVYFEEELEVRHVHAQVVVPVHPVFDLVDVVQYQGEEDQRHDPDAADRQRSVGAHLRLAAALLDLQPVVAEDLAEEHLSEVAVR